MGTSNNLWTWSTTAGSNTTADAGINWSEGQAPSTINDSARGMMAAVARWRSDLGAITSAGTANAQTLTTNTGLTALATGNTVIFKVGSGLSNTAAATLNVDGLGAKALRQFTAGGEVALSGGELQAGQRYIATYDTALNSGSGAWVVLNPTPASGTGFASTSTTITGTGYVTGGGNLGANRTLSLGTMGAASRLMGSSSSSSTITDITVGSGLSMSGSTLSSTATGTITGVTAGTGLSGGGTSGGVTLNISMPVFAWGRVDSAGSLTAGGNISSTSKTATGTYTVNFSSAASSSNYAVVGMSSTGLFVQVNGSSLPGTSSFSYVIRSNGGSNTDGACWFIVVGG